jgi:hypothetical protein
LTKSVLIHIARTYPEHRLRREKRVVQPILAGDSTIILGESDPDVQLQRVLNGGAKLTREAAVGRDRIDMRIEWKGFKHILEIKVVHPRKSRETTLQAGLKQIARYAEKVGRDATQTLAIFDHTPTGHCMPWEERLQREEHKDVTVHWL